MAVYAAVLVFFALGVLLRDRIGAPQRIILVLNKYIIWFALPALILSTVPNVQLQQMNLFPAIMAWSLLLVAFLFASLLGRLRGWSREMVYAVAMLMGLGNTAFLGLPLIALLLGEDYLVPAIIYDQFGSSMLLFIVLPVVVALLSKSDSARVSIWSIGKKILMFPPFVTLLLALLIPSTNTLGLLYPIFVAVAKTIAPLAMLVVGLQFYFRIERNYHVPILAVLCFRSLIAPLFVFAIGGALSVSSLHVYAAIMQSAMPPMITAVIILASEGIAARFVTSMLGVGTLVACVTLPLLSLLLN